MRTRTRPVNALLRAAVLLLATAPLFVAKGFHVPVWEIVLSAAAGSALGQLAVYVARERPRLEWMLVAGTVAMLVGSIAVLLRPAGGPLARRLILVTNGEPPSLVLDDALAIQELPEVMAVAPVERTNAQLVAEDSNWSAPVLGTTPSLLAVHGWRVARGKAFSDDDVSSAAKVLVLGSTTANQLFGATEPVGASIRIKSHSFLVVGILAPTGETNSDDLAIVPYNTFERSIAPTMGHVFRGQFLILPKSGAQADPILALLRERHHLTAGNADDFVLKDVDRR